MSVLAADEIPTLSLLYKLGKLPSTPSGDKIPTTISFKPAGPITPSKSLNDRVCLVRHDITKLEVDAVTNAANKRLLGGGGIDGAIHSAAGPGLLAECRTLGGCNTGDAKITGGHNLPAKNIIHAVGPIYDAFAPEDSEVLLTSAYNKVLNLAVDNECKTLALCGISTGIYGYPPHEAAPVAISTVKKFLESEKGEKLEKIVFVTWVKQDVESYAQFLPVYFPPVEDAAKSEPKAEAEANPEEVEAAKEIASKLPDVPTSEPGDSEHPEKKQKQ
ncbi:macro domain-containing protein [Diaporthe helianthi]|uniref:Macro domain-containing protein n=1 Tax=Diaporthe helianthi TaxID=158607 RepID=A0A2P5HR23_DIAHE|nr:macro domain-containing protein [Diaporthe helianthi]